jgi:hypothetical protein
LKLALYDTAFIPKFLDYLLSPTYIGSKIDWGNILISRMGSEPIEVNENKECCWKNREDIQAIISFGLTQQPVKKDFLLPSLASIGDAERAGLFFLASHSNDDEFIIVMPFMSMKILNRMLLSYPGHSLFPDELFLIPTIDHPWQWQDFESLHGYYQKALIKALINVKNSKILALEQSIEQLTIQLNQVTEAIDSYNIQMQIREKSNCLDNEK